MADETEVFKPWKGRVLAAALIVAGVLHAVKPSWLLLDWPSITLILAGVVLIFLSLEDVGQIFESLEFGKTKILFRKAQKLNDSVVKAEREEESATPSLPLSGEQEAVLDQVEASDGSTSGRPFRESDFRSLLQVDKQMALIRIGIEIERVLAQLESLGGVAVSHKGIIWGKAVTNLAARNVISQQVKEALVEFRDVRNQLIHSSAGAVSDRAVTSTVDSGLRLLEILSLIRDELASGTRTTLSQ